MLDRITQSTYDQIAGLFDERTAMRTPGLDRRAELFARLVGPRGRVLDVGCGPGRDSLWFQAQGLTVVGVDLSTGMLKEARAKAVRNLAQMDMLHLAVRDHCFEGLWCSAALLHLPKHLAPLALAEFKRVLVPRGLLFLSLQEGASEGLEPVSYSSVPLQRFFARYQQEEFEAMLRSGFEITECTNYVFGPRRWLDFLAVSI